MGSTLEELKLERPIWPKILVVVIVAIVLLIVFGLTPVIIDLLTGDINNPPSDQLHGSVLIISLLV